MSVSDCEAVKPFMKCVDYWPKGIPAGKLAAYKEMIRCGQIRKHHVFVNRVSGSTTVEYYSTVPHEWIRAGLAKQEKELKSGGVQECMELGPGE